MDPPGKYRVILYDIDNAYVYRNVDEQIRDDVMDVLDQAEDERVIPTEGWAYTIKIILNANNMYYMTLTRELFDRVKAMLDHSRNRGRHDHSYDRDMDSLAACVSALRLRVSRLESACRSHLLNFTEQFGEVMSIPEETTVDAWAAGVLHGSH
jgi:hypothetical protein